MDTKSGSQTRRLVTVGFGGLMLLIAFAGLNGISVVRTIENRNDRIRDDYVSRNRILQLLRSDIYLSGTYVRDLLLERDPALGDTHRRELEKARQRIDTNRSAYKKILRPEEKRSFNQFDSELDAYFKSLAPALQWTPAERAKLGYSFINESLLPRRMETVRLADQLSDLNQKQLEAGNRQVKDLFKNFQQSLLLILVLCLACGAILTAVTAHRLLGLETATRLHLQEVTQTRGELRHLSARLLEIQESERRAISRELHDEVGQAVSGLLLGVGNVMARLPEADSEVLRLLGELKGLAERTVAAVRDMSLLLRPSMLDDLGLLPALRWQAREISRNKNIFVRVIADEVSEDRLNDEQRTCVYRVVQEALLNVVRHARATSVDIHFSATAENLLLVVEDNGRGFMPSQERGLGLLGMEERVHHLNGTVAIKSQPGSGTTIRVEIPVVEQGDPQAS
jgi:signal transduction histidine kinase